MGLGRVVVSAALVAALALMAGCGVRPSVDPAASSEELAASFADCRWGDGVDRGEPVAEFEHVAEWLRVTAVVAADRDAEGYAPAQVRDAAGATRDVEVHHGEWRAVDWALENDAEVWFVIGDPGESRPTVPMVGLTMIVTPAGSVFFPGGCFDRWLRQQVGEPLGDRIDEALAELPHVALRRRA